MSLNNFIILFIVQLGIKDYATHEFYVSTTSVDFVLNKNEIQITSQFFVDDVENLIRFQTPNTALIFEKAYNEETNLIMRDFIHKNFKISINKKKQQVKYLGYELKDDLLVVYYETKFSNSKIFNVEVYNSFLVNFIKSQKNIVHVKFKNLKKSFLLNSINKTFRYSFEK
ncbi:MAG: hypothetical protein CMC48_06125 [Flavobacteriaceae bacterium]|nr:hypothetical protein [Flavobacteriaceae bacterium]|tara:strand:- start:1492 stop:2001 length:510 start_codon:yes stop_codon:yes gene_type:complete